jgi:hypothetical protein
MTAVLGDFLRPARAHITAAARHGGDLSVPARRGVITELDRLVATMTRYLDDLALPDDFTPASTANPEVRASLDARLAVRRAAASLHPAAAAIREAGAHDAHPAVGHLSSANGYLTAGRDLLQTHFTSGPAGQPVGSTWWAAVITSPPVTAALLAELAACSRRLAAWTAQLSRTGSLYAGLPAVTSQGLRTASRWLRVAGNGVQTAHLRQPPAVAGQRLLAAIPPAVPPPRQPSGNIEPVAELCAGITVTAERLRRAAGAFAGQARWSPAANSLSWRRDALASAITTHASELILRSVAERARQLAAGSAVQAQLAGAADAVSRAWPAWQAIARHWDTVSTGIHHAWDLSPVAAELEDLVLRTGRLAYDNPHWTPACADASPARDPADLAATAGDIRVVLAAVHHATDAISRIATFDTEAVRDAAADRRLYLPTRLLPEHYDIPCPYAPLPPPMAGDLIVGYDATARASLRASIALDDLAVAIDAPSSMLAAGRTPARSPVSTGDVVDHDSVRQPALPAPPAGVLRPQAGQIEDILRRLHITEPGMLVRAAAIDDAACDVLAHASESSRIRDGINQQPLRLRRRTPGKAPGTAAKDVTHAGADAGRNVICEGPVSGLPAGRAPQRAQTNSRGHSPAT